MKFASQAPPAGCRRYRIPEAGPYAGWLLLARRSTLAPEPLAFAAGGP